MLALVNALKALPSSIKDCRLDVDVDSRVLIDVWEGQGSKGSPQLTKATKDLFFELAECNLQLRLSHVKSSHNPADGPSRRLSRLDSKLSDESWGLVEQTFGGTSGHSFDLMALDSNAAIGRSGSLLPHFTPFPTPDSRGALMSRIARSCEIYKFYDFSQFLQDNDFSAVCCEIYEFLHFFVMLINSVTTPEPLADFTKFA